MEFCSTRPAPTEAYMTVPQHHRSTVFNTTPTCGGVRRNPLHAKNESSTPLRKLLSGDGSEKEVHNNVFNDNKGRAQTGRSFAAASREPRARGRSSAANTPDKDSFAACLRTAHDASGLSPLTLRADNTNNTFMTESKKSNSASYHVYDSKKDQSGVYTSFLRLQQKMVSLGFDDWSSIREADVFGGVLFPFAAFLRFLLQEGAPEVTLSLMTEYDWFLVEVDDKALIKSLYRVLAERFQYRPSITAAQFCQSSSPLSALPAGAYTTTPVSTSPTTVTSASPMPINALNTSRKTRGRSHPPAPASSFLGSSPSVPYNSRATVSSSICVSIGRQNSAALRSASLLRNGGANHAAAKVQFVRDVIGLFLRAKADLENDADRLRNFRELILEDGHGKKSENARLFLSDLRRDEDRSRLGEALIQRRHHYLQSFVDPEANMTVDGEEHKEEKKRDSGADPVSNPLVFAALLAMQKKKDSDKSIMPKNSTSTSGLHLSPALRLREVTATTNNAVNSTLSLPHQRLKTKDANTQLVLTPPTSEQRHDTRNTAGNPPHGTCCRHLRHVLTREEDLKKESMAQEARRLAMLHKALNKLQREKSSGEDQP